MTAQEFERVWRAGSGSPILRKIGDRKTVFIAGQGFFADSQSAEDISFIGLWSPKEWQAGCECSAFIEDESSTKEMMDWTWQAYTFDSLEFTGKYCNKI